MRFKFKPAYNIYWPYRGEIPISIQSVAINALWEVVATFGVVRTELSRGNRSLRWYYNWRAFRATFGVPRRRTPAIGGAELVSCKIDLVCDTTYTSITNIGVINTSPALQLLFPATDNLILYAVYPSHL